MLAQFADRCAGKKNLKVIVVERNPQTHSRARNKYRKSAVSASAKSWSFSVACETRKEKNMHVVARLSVLGKQV